jgi:hypothetical protein
VARRKMDKDLLVYSQMWWCASEFPTLWRLRQETESSRAGLLLNGRVLAYHALGSITSTSKEKIRENVFASII